MKTHKPMLEKQLEAKLGKYARSRGCLWIKFTSPARPSVPDRILIGPAGTSQRIMFIELKRQGEKPTLGQLNEQMILINHGMTARWTDNFEEGKGWVDEVCS
jgi:hypothetical protein